MRKVEETIGEVGQKHIRGCQMLEDCNRYLGPKEGSEEGPTDTRGRH